MTAPDGTGPDPADLEAALRARTEAAAADLEAALGGVAACTRHKYGRVTGGMKYHEGRMVSYAEARRALAGGGLPVSRALHEHAQRWRDEFRRRAGGPEPWLAYATGGLEAAEDAAALAEQGSP